MRRPVHRRGAKEMANASQYLPAGVIPAVLLPFHDDLSIDEASYRAHLRDVAAVEGVSPITVNATSRRRARRSEKHTSELPSHREFVCRLQPEQKKNQDG